MCFTIYFFFHYNATISIHFHYITTRTLSNTVYNSNKWKNIDEVEFSKIDFNWLPIFTEPSDFIWNSEPKPTTLDYFKLFVNDEIINNLVNQSNIFLKHFLSNYEDIENINFYTNFYERGYLVIY